MQEKSKRSLVFVVVATVALGSTIASAGLGRRGRGQFAEMEAKVLAETSAKSRGAPKYAPSVPEYRLGMKDVELARGGVTSGDRSAAVQALIRVLERADRIDRQRALIASLITAKLLDQVVDCVEKDPRLLDDPQLATALRRTSFSSSRRPLDAERLHALNVLGSIPTQVPIQTLGFTESVTTAAMHDVDATLHEMEASTLAGDTARCEVAAQKTHGLAQQVTVGPSVCRSAANVVASGQRFQRLQARAAASLPRGAMKVARLPVAL